MISVGASQTYRLSGPGHNIDSIFSSGEYTISMDTAYTELYTYQIYWTAGTNLDNHSYVAIDDLESELIIL